MANKNFTVYSLLHPKAHRPSIALSGKSAERQFTQSLSLAAPGKHLPQGHGASVAPWYKSIVYFAWDSLTVPLGKRFPSLSLNLDAAKRKSPAAWLLSCPAAFSLVEMLMALLVASLLLAALAPVITKRFGENLSVAGATGGGRAPAMFKCWDYDSPELQMATDGSNQKVLPEDYPVEDAWYVNFIIASGGGGGAGATSSKTTDDTYENSDTDVSDGIKITYDMDEFDIEFMTGGGGGAGGGAAISDVATCTGSPSEDKCECMGTLYDSNNGSCVSGKVGKKNFSDAATLCSQQEPAGKWSVVQWGQVSNWSSSKLYEQLGIVSDDSIWTCDTGSYCASSYSCTKYGCKYKYCYNCAKADSNYTGTSSSYKTYYYCKGSTYASYPSCTCPSSCKYGPYSSTVSGYSSLSSCNNAINSSSTSSSNYNYTKCTACSSYRTTCCSSYGTYYYYYYLSGTSWSGNSSSNDSATLRDVYCRYTDSGSLQGIKVYSISGGGGGSSPAIKTGGFDSSIKETLNNKIKENIGGYLVLDVGKGGDGGSASAGKQQKAGDGVKGSDSCIIVRDSSKKDVYKVCVPGGNPGTGGDASQADSSTNGYGRGGSEIPATNSCYAIDYTTNTLGEKVNFNCSDAGKAGGLGGAATTNPTPGGKGGASVKNPSVQAANSGKDGVTPVSLTNPGAGGGGGSTLKTGFGKSATVAYGMGGNGANGYIKLKYKHKYEAAGGGGGGAGYIAHLTNMSVGKSATCSIRVGYGGAGGAAGSKGHDGGESSIVCSNAPNITYKVYGGKGGELGVSAEGSSGVSTGGLGGEAGGYDNTGNIFTRLLNQGNLKMYEGEKGAQAASGDTSNYKVGFRSAGGRGGSNVSEKGKCGGLYNEAAVCETVTADENNDISTPSQEDLNGKGFSTGDIITPTKDSVAEETPKFGKAGAGGGGGAWYAGKSPGAGGAGLGGYVCIYWNKAED